MEGTRQSVHRGCCSKTALLPHPCLFGRNPSRRYILAPLFPIDIDHGIPQLRGTPERRLSLAIPACDVCGMKPASLVAVAKGQEEPRQAVQKHFTFAALLVMLIPPRPCLIRVRIGSLRYKSSSARCQQPQLREPARGPSSPFEAPPSPPRRASCCGSSPCDASAAHPGHVRGGRGDKSPFHP